MGETRKPDAAGNQGIQANTVTADVLAVGMNAMAHKQVAVGATPEAFLQAITQFRSALEGLMLPTPAKQVLAADVEALTAASSASKSDNAKIQSHLKGLSDKRDKLKMVGIVMKDVAELWEPAKKIAELAMIPLHLVGL
jgi:hypothetical protein